MLSVNFLLVENKSYFSQVLLCKRWCNWNY